MSRLATPIPSMVTPIGKPVSSDLLAALVSRCTFGPTASDMQAAQSLGYMGYLAYQLDHQSIDDGVCENTVSQRYPILKYNGNLLYPVPSGDVRNQLVQARLHRAIMSKRQLFEVMVEFWSDHFSIYLFDEGVDKLKVGDDRDVVRANALGSFPAMLNASARSPAMLAYLNNDTNTRTAPNENYARELMELHTLGVDGGYTQNDVIAVARCFTGWRYVTGTATTPGLYTFQYNSGTHDTNAKVLSPIFDIAGGFQNNVTIPARSASAGMQDGIDVLNILANHPNTAKFVSRKMLRYLWGYTPSQAMVDALAGVYMTTGGSIRSMVAWVLDPARLAGATWKLKRPMHLLVSAARATNAAVTATANVQTALTGAGHLPFNWLTPDGYPDSISAWVDLQLPRWSFGASLMNNEYYTSATGLGLLVDIVPLLQGAVTSAQVLNRIEKVLYPGGKMPAEDRAAVATYLGVSNPSTTKIKEAFGVAMGCPGFQWY